MPLLSTEQIDQAIKVMREYLAAKNPDGTTPLQVQTERDKRRIELIEGQLGELLSSYLDGDTDLATFKSLADGLNKREPHWGFKGIKGQMFFNLLVNVADDEGELDAELKAAMRVPDGEKMARSRIRTFESYVRRIGDQFVEAGGSKHGRPKPGSIPFFLSYFWQVQNYRTWPVYYTNSVKTMVDMNLWQPTGELAEDYIAFKHVHEELCEALTQASGQDFDLYMVEHVFWFKGGNPFGGAKPIKPKEGQALAGTAMVEDVVTISRLPESYVPPIIAILPRMARNEPELAEAAKASGTSLERAFEKHINAAFTILGYETKLMGAGQGRVPDGLAVDVDNSYAILWDAKVRTGGYSMGTDDRTIREYIVTQSRDLKKKRSLRNIYYLVVSSEFADDYDDAVRTLKMDTHVSEVCLVEAAALVAMVDAKLREPQQITLGPDGLQRLFCTSGVLSADNVRDALG